MRAIGMLHCNTWTQVSTAALTDGKEQTAETIVSGRPWIFNVVLVIKQRVPSEPTIRFVRFNPAEVFLSSRDDLLFFQGHNRFNTITWSADPFRQ